MPITSKGKTWEILNSWWMLFSFTVGFFNWIGFLYIGIRAKKIKWLIFGFIYAIPFIFAMIFTGTPYFETWVGNVITVITLVVGVVSLIHSFTVRKEFLLRLEAIQMRGVIEDEALKRRVKNEFGVEQSINSKPTRETLISDEKVKQVFDNIADKPEKELQTQPSLSDSDIDINNASEFEIASLPGIGAILAKRAIEQRQNLRGFQTVEQFGEVLGLKPHMIERIRPLIVVGRFDMDSPENIHGRVVDL